MTRDARRSLAVATAWAALVGVALAARPALPIDETRYLSVAWEMWQGHNLLLPVLNGVPYSDKPPLLFWLIHAGWWAFGVNELWPRIVPPLVGLVNVFLVGVIARRLWGDADGLAWRARLLLLGCLLWALFTTLVMFDMLLTAAVLVSMLGTLLAWHESRGRAWLGWLVFASAVGLGLLAKGPVVLLHTLPAPLLAPWWAIDRPPGPWHRWYAAVGLAALAGIGIALAWALPAARAGGPAYGYAILLSQTTGRIAHAFAHRRPLWWYLPLLPLLLFPWAWWPPLWRAVRALASDPRDAGVRFCLAWFVPAFVGLSATSGKQMHYLLPIVPALALLGARALTRQTQDAARPRRGDARPPALAIALLGAALLVAPHVHVPRMLSVWTVDIPPAAGMALFALAAALLAAPIASVDRALVTLTGTVVLGFALLHVVLMPVAAPDYDMRPTAAYLGSLEQQGYVIAHVGAYKGQYHFAGRLAHPFDIVNRAGVEAWSFSHPRGAVISYVKRRTAGGAGCPGTFSRPYRGGWVCVTVTSGGEPRGS